MGIQMGKEMVYIISLGSNAPTSLQRGSCAEILRMARRPMERVTAAMGRRMMRLASRRAMAFITSTRQSSLEAWARGR